MFQNQAPMTRTFHSSRVQSGIRRRQGVSLLEVLFAIMVASVGLLGAIAVFPVALSMARKGRLADTTAVGANAAVAKFNAELMRRPDRWLYWDAANTQTQFLPLAFNQPGNAFYGRAFCIDPRFFERNRVADATDGQNNSTLWPWFPAVPEVAGANAIPHASRMVRLTLHNNNPAALLNAQSRMSFIQADKVFRIEDELLYDRPDDNSLPAVQLFEKMDDGSGNAIPSKRQEEGRLTWMATLVPKHDRLGGPIGEEYVLSIVVFYNRPDDIEVPNQPNNNLDRPWTEWTAKILGGTMASPAGDYYASGIGGGEVRLTTNDPAQDPNFNGAEFLEVKSGTWLMLARTIPVINATPIQYFQWYRVSDADETLFDNSSNRWYQEATLVGPDWPVDLVDNGSGAATPDGLADECDVILVRDVIHVYERTVKIDTGAAP